jgi:2-dehydro-3-deoxyphosphogluconate aldolase/(4S)-4-hydroxy-2-oxoglutarate aldolase
MHRIGEKRIVPAATVENADDGIRLAEALLEAGLDVIEVTFRTGAAVEAVRGIAKRFSGMLVGAGTVLTVEQLARAVEAGAKFGVAPGLNEAVVGKAQELGLAFIPGVATPTEIDRGLSLGCRLLKFFPASVMGGVEALKAFAGPFAHTGVKFVPTGGISASNAKEYLKLPVVAAVGGSWMVAKELIAAGKWDEITRLTREALSLK